MMVLLTLFSWQKVAKRTAEPYLHAVATLFTSLETHPELLKPILQFVEILSYDSRLTSMNSGPIFCKERPLASFRA
jgi:hypothetical protein